MAILLFLLWIVLNGRFTLDRGMLEIVIFGVIVMALVYVFAIKVLGFKLKNELHFWRNVFLLIAYIAVLIWEMLKSNFTVVSIILNKMYIIFIIITSIRI